jgi:hypothetical protein
MGAFRAGGGGDIEEFKSGRLHEKHAVATWEPPQHFA